MALEPGGVALWRVGKAKKSNRRRIVCQPRAGGVEEDPDRAQAGLPPLQQMRASAPSPVRVGGSASPKLPKATEAGPVGLTAHSEPLSVSIRLLYFSRDGSPADTGEAHELQVTTDTSVEALLDMARKAAGVGAKGRLLFRNKPLTNDHLIAKTLGDCGVPSDPKALHLVLSRKYRPSAVAAAAAAEAAELRAAMVEAEAAAAMRPKRQKRVIEDENPQESLECLR